MASVNHRPIPAAARRAHRRARGANFTRAKPSWPSPACEPPVRTEPAPAGGLCRYHHGFNDHSAASVGRCMTGRCRVPCTAFCRRPATRDQEIVAAGAAASPGKTEAEDAEAEVRAKLVSDECLDGMLFDIPLCKPGCDVAGDDCVEPGAEELARVQVVNDLRTVASGLGSAQVADDPLLAHRPGVSGQVQRAESGSRTGLPSPAGGTWPAWHSARSTGPGRHRYHRREPARGS